MEHADRYPNEPNTMTAAVERFVERGYLGNFHARGGKLISDVCPGPHDPETMIVEDFRRFEGVTNPDDESTCFALRCREHNTRGTYCASYGPLADAEDADVMQKLSRHPH